MFALLVKHPVLFATKMHIKNWAKLKRRPIARKKQPNYAANCAMACVLLIFFLFPFVHIGRYKFAGLPQLASSFNFSLVTKFMSELCPSLPSILCMCISLFHYLRTVCHIHQRRWVSIHSIGMIIAWVVSESTSSNNQITFDDDWHRLLLTFGSLFELQINSLPQSTHTPNTFQFKQQNRTFFSLCVDLERPKLQPTVLRYANRDHEKNTIVA